MKIISYRSNSKCWKLWLEHYVIYDWKVYWSWEYRLWIFWITWWHFKKYNELEFNKDCDKIYDTYEIENINMWKFANLYKEWYTCIEIIHYILNKEHMGTPKKLNSELGKIFRTLILFIIYTAFILAVWWFLWMKYYIAEYTISEEEYIENPQNILLDN